jgi:hypothetical protein
MADHIIVEKPADHPGIQVIRLNHHARHVCRDDGRAEIGE